MGSDIHKAIYPNKGPQNTILAYQLMLAQDVADEIIVVTGYKHEDIECYLKRYFSHLPLKIVYNEHYADYGSNYSLILGIQTADERADELIFLEGDLVFDAIAFRQIVRARKNVITSNKSLIDASKSVVFYVNDKKQITYLYDPSHHLLKVDEPFLVMGNSGQVWKFTNVKKLKNNLKHYEMKDYKATNLVLINDYYKDINYENIEMVTFDKWFNCNTVQDFEEIKNYMCKEK